MNADNNILVEAPTDAMPGIFATSTPMGFWVSEIPKNGIPKLYGNAKMMYLLGVDENIRMTPEELHFHWYNRVDPDYYPEVEKYFEALKQGRDSEIEYPWNHPSLGRIIVRCGGKRRMDLDDKVIVEGYHRDISNVLHFQKHSQRTVAEMTIADSVLSLIARKTYSLIITVYLASGKFTFIEGTGMEVAAADFRASKDYRECYNRLYDHALPEYKKQLCMLASLDYLRNAEDANGHIGTLEYLSDADGISLWRELSVYINTEASGERVANILIRDTDSIHREQSIRRKEMMAVNSRNKVLAEITRKMYGFNVTVDLDSAEYTIISGVGLENVMPIMQSTNHYPTVLDRMLSMVDSVYVVSLRKLLGIDFLRVIPESDESIGTVTFCSHIIGKPFWHEVNVFRTKDELGRPIANILCRDVTKLKAAEEQQLREERKKMFNDTILSQVTRSLYGYNIMVNLNTQHFTLIEGSGTDNVVQILKKFTKYEDVVEAKLKYVDSSYVKALYDLVSLKSLREASASGRTGFLQTLVYKVAFEGKDGWHEVSVFIGTDENGAPIANLLGRDVTERQNKQFAELENERATNAARSFFFSNVSHDIRTPLNAIIGYAEMLQTGIEDKAERQQALDSIATSGTALMHLINDVLDLSKLEKGKMDIIPEPTDVAKLIKDTFGAFAPVCHKKSLEMIVDVKEMPQLILDPQRIRQVIFNLLGNAVKFTDEGHIKVSATWEDNCLSISIEDTGCGISQVDCKRLMTPYVQVNGSGRHGGTGLGLSISSQLAKRMGGELTLTSNYGEGSTFTITIPRVKEATAANTATTELKNGNRNHVIEKHEPLRPYIPKSAMIVDDTLMNLKVLSLMLRQLGIRNVYEASSGAEALEKLRDTRVEVVLTDLWMPEINGAELAKRFRAAEHAAGRDAVPVCAVTADVEVLKGNNAGDFDGILLKPISLANLRMLFADLRGGGANLPNQKII